MKKSTLLHLRIPFSFFLLPIFLFASSIDTITDPFRFWTILFILHFLLYPASNGYNSYFDKDEGSIGGLRNPPPTSKELYSVSLLLDVAAIAIALLINIVFAVGVLIYGLVSKAYSHPSVRIKKYPIASWFIAGFFQGWFTLVISYAALHDLSLADLANTKLQLAGALSSAILWGSYPMTQIYQHEEDQKRGDETLSIKLGIIGTFIFTLLCFGVASIAFWFFYRSYGQSDLGWFFLAFMTPVVLFFLYWFRKVLADTAKADFQNTMTLNIISSVCLNLFFLFVIILNLY